MLNKEQKKSYINEMTAHFEKFEAVLVAHYQGLSVKQLQKLRAKMREHRIPEIGDKFASLKYFFQDIIYIKQFRTTLQVFLLH